MSTKPNEKPNWNELVNNQLLNMKKRTAQVKGEAMDGLTEIIADDFKGFSQIAQQLVGQIDQKDKKIADLEKKLEDVYNAHPELKIKAESKETVKVSGKK